MININVHNAKVTNSLKLSNGTVTLEIQEVNGSTITLYFNNQYEVLEFIKLARREVLKND